MKKLILILFFVFTIGLSSSLVFAADDVKYLVKYIDYNGMVLKYETVESGGSVTPPTAPNHDGLTFDEWTATSTNVTSNLDISATYITTDGKTMLGLRSTVATGLDAALYLNKSDGSTLTVDWGDGSSNDFTNTGNFNTGTHTYATYGDYEVKMWISSGNGTYGFGNGSTTTTVVGGDTQIQRDMLLYVFVGESVTSIGDSVFSTCYSLTNIVIPSSIASIGNYAFITCYSLTNIVIPSSVASIGNYAFQGCYSLTNIVIPSSVTSIGISAFNACRSLTTYVFERTAGITTIGGTNTFTNINSSTKIYVPDDLVDDYKIADNWSTYANYIYPLSDKGVTHNDYYYDGYNYYDDVYDDGYELGYDDGYELGYDEGVIMTDTTILWLTLILFLVGVGVFFLIHQKIVLMATSLLLFVPIFRLENIFIVVFCVIIFILMNLYVFFAEKPSEEY